MRGYCLNCKRKNIQIDSFCLKQTKNSRNLISGKCRLCGGNVARFISAEQAEKLAKSMSKSLSKPKRKSRSRSRSSKPKRKSRSRQCPPSLFDRLFSL